MFTKPRAALEHHGPAAPEPTEVHHPDEMSFVFNPIKTRGSTTVRIRFTFDYIVDKSDRHDAFEAIKLRWDKAYDRCLEVLTEQQHSALSSSDGKRRLKKLLADELTLMLFPESLQADQTRARVAVVSSILWLEFFLQN